MTRANLSASDRIRELRSAIRYHRDQVGDDRCWLDDERLWALLPNSATKRTSLPIFEEMMRRCTAFHRFRNSSEPDEVPANATLDATRWDNDLASLDAAGLDQELTRMQAAVQLHRDIRDRERTLDDDRTLYRTLPEQVTADFRLPSEDAFLGEARAPQAGCPSFWRSHQHCATEEHQLSQWGPCTTQNET